MLNDAHSQQFMTEEQLKAMNTTRNLFSFKGYLSRKGGPKSYTEEKKPTYRLNLLGVFSASILRILSAFMAISAFLTGIFFGSPSAGAFVAVVLLFSLEYLQMRNATELLQRWFFKGKINRTNIIYGAIFSLCTGIMAFSGVNETIRFVSESIQPFEFDEKKVNPTLLSDIQKADESAAEFYTARSWKGKMDGKDAKQYNILKKEASDLRKQYREELTTAKLNAKTAYDQDVSGKKTKESNNRAYLTLFIIFSECLFWLAFYHKERFEFLAFREAELTGTIKDSGSTAPPRQQVITQPVRNGQPQNF